MAKDSKYDELKDHFESRLVGAKWGREQLQEDIQSLREDLAAQERVVRRLTRALEQHTHGVFSRKPQMVLKEDSNGSPDIETYVYNHSY